jgi:hypothetical protein
MVGVDAVVVVPVDVHFGPVVVCGPNFPVLGPHAAQEAHASLFVCGDESEGGPLLGHLVPEVVTERRPGGGVAEPPVGHLFVLLDVAELKAVLVVSPLGSPVGERPVVPAAVAVLRDKRLLLLVGGFVLFDKVVVVLLRHFAVGEHDRPVGVRFGRVDRHAAALLESLRGRHEPFGDLDGVAIGDRLDEATDVVFWSVDECFVVAMVRHCRLLPLCPFRQIGDYRRKQQAPTSGAKKY